MINLLCMECSNRFTANETDNDPECPACGSTDYEVEEP